MNAIGKVIHTVRQTVSQINRKRLASSLQFRLTTGVTLASALALGMVAGWTTWTMQQLLVTSHIQNVTYIAGRFPRDVKLYGEMLPIATALERAILQADASANDPGNGFSPPDVPPTVRTAPSNLFIWVKGIDNKVLAQSQTLTHTSGDFAHVLMEQAEMPSQPQVFPIDDRYLVLYHRDLRIDSTLLGQLYIAEDVTREQMLLNDVIHRVTIATTLTILLLTLAITLYIRRSLQPLRQMSQIAGEISADGLSQARLYLDRAPHEVQELAQMLDSMLLRLSQSWEQQRQFVSNVSHELRTPLSVVYGYLQSLLRRGATLSPAQREAVEISAAETERTIRLLQDLLELARADSGYLSIHLETVDLHDWVRETVGTGEKFNRCIQVESEQAVIWARIDRDRMTQVLFNLIDNAAKYSDPPTPIGVKLAQTGESTTLQVCDRGCGIPFSQQTRIFERFYRVDAARARFRQASSQPSPSSDATPTTDGTGLGLAIVKSLVEGMEGQVSVWSKPGEGSKFTVTLPTHPVNYDGSHSPSRR